MRSDEKVSRVHIIGAGMAGLAAAVKLTREGLPVTLYEGAGHAGGRCRSFLDKALGAVIDNGNHLILSGNLSVQSYLSMIDARETFETAEAVFPFLDLKTGERWQVRPGAGKFPFWLLRKGRGIPGVKFPEYLAAFRINNAAPGKTVVETTGGKGLLYQRFWEPMTLAAPNTPPGEASAILLKAVLDETFFKGAKFCRPMLAAKGLTQSFIDPALKFLKAGGVKIHFKTRLREVVRDNGKMTALKFSLRTAPLGTGDQVILALPPNITSTLVKEVEGPAEFHAIVNVHFRLPKKAAGEGSVPFLGLLGGTAHWLFIRGGIASVTVSAADRLAEKSAGEIAKLIWRDVARALGTGNAKIPAYRVIKEKRATFSQTPANLRKRAPQKGPLPNLYLAGDWTQTYIPATIESAVRSGFFAARAVIRDRDLKTGKKE